MKKKVFDSTATLKKAFLNKSNWEKVKQNTNWCYYRHKTRKRVQLQLDTKTMKGMFWDKSKNKVISPVKLIVWK